MVLFAFLVAPQNAPAQATPNPLDGAALHWLGLLDAGKFAEAWQAGGALLRASTSEDDWIVATERVREGFGVVDSRMRLTRDFHMELEGEPDGKYFTLRFRTRLASGREEIEVVTLAADDDGRYRVVAYGLKR